MYKILRELNLILAPVLVHTAEEIYEHTPHTDKESVHLELYPEREETDAELVGKWQKFMTVRDDVYKALEEARNEKVIGKSLDAKVTLTQPALIWMISAVILSSSLSCRRLKWLKQSLTVQLTTLLLLKLNMLTANAVTAAGTIQLLTH